MARCAKLLFLLALVVAGPIGCCGHHAAQLTLSTDGVPADAGTGGMFCWNEGLAWSRDGAEWPHREVSRFVNAGGLRWHVQQMGEGPVVLLVHGTGASTHSWRDLASVLSAQFTVVMPDLPGHGFTSAPAPSRLSLPGMAAALEELLLTLEVRPIVAIGHSAGAAILVRMTLDGRLRPDGLVSLNGALLPFPGLARHLFPPLARLLFLNPFAPRFFSWSANDRDSVKRLLEDTGSTLAPEGVDLYTRLFRNSGHVGATLGMMANWDLEPLEEEFARLHVPILLVAAEEDGAVAPDVATRVATQAPNAEVITLPALGHLAHEEDPRRVAALIKDFVGRLPVSERAEPKEL